MRPRWTARRSIGIRAAAKRSTIGEYTAPQVSHDLGWEPRLPLPAFRSMKSVVPFVAAAASLVWTIPASAQAVPVFHASLRGWAESSWLQILDRNGAAGGRLSERGILERFSQRIDDKYFLDRLSADFSPVEDYAWYARSNGVRWGVASITKRDLIVDADFKVRAALTEKWGIGVRFNKVDLPEARRSPIRIQLRRRISASVGAFAEGHFDPRKPGFDIEAGVDWRSAGGARVEATIAVLDPANDLVFLNFNAQRQVDVDSTLEYERQPIAARASVSVPVTAAVRLEVHGAFMRPSTILQYEGLDTTAGLRQHERFAYVGGLLEWTPTPSVMAAVFASTIRARSLRSPLSALAPVRSYRLTEQTTQVGALGMVRLSPRWVGDVWLRHAWQPERRVFLAGDGVDVDFLLRSFNSQAMLTYTARGGFTADVGVGWNRARTPRGEGQVPSSGTLAGIQYRVRFDLGWRNQDRFVVLVGSATDIDGEGQGGASFGGARGRFMLFW